FYNFQHTGQQHQCNNQRHHRVQPILDRKSTRLNSSHVKISYAVFCLKKKTLQRSCKIEYDSNNKERQSITICNLMQCTLKGHHKIGRTRHYLNNHSHTSYFFLCLYRHHHNLHSFPTRRSSDLLLQFPAHWTTTPVQ